MVRWNLFKKTQPRKNDYQEKPTFEPVHQKDNSGVDEEQPTESKNVYNHTLYSIEYPRHKQPKAPQASKYKKTEYIDICKIEHNIDKIDDKAHQKSSEAKDAYFIGELEHRVDHILERKKQTK